MTDENPQERTAAVAAERRPDGTFGPGNAANPGGQPKWLKQVRESLKALTPLAAERLKGIILDGEDKDSVAAAKVVLEYTVPKPKQTHKVEGGGRILTDVTTQALVEFITGKREGK